MQLNLIGAITVKATRKANSCMLCKHQMA